MGLCSQGMHNLQKMTNILQNYLRDGRNKTVLHAENIFPLPREESCQQCLVLLQCPYRQRTLRCFANAAVSGFAWCLLCGNGFFLVVCRRQAVGFLQVGVG